MVYVWKENQANNKKNSTFIIPWKLWKHIEQQKTTCGLREWFHCVMKLFERAKKKSFFYRSMFDKKETLFYENALHTKFFEKSHPIGIFFLWIAFIFQILTASLMQQNWFSTGWGFRL